MSGTVNTLASVSCRKLPKSKRKSSKQLQLVDTISDDSCESDEELDAIMASVGVDMATGVIVKEATSVAKSRPVVVSASAKHNGPSAAPVDRAFSLTSDQASAFRLVSTCNSAIIIGGQGTGKTVVIRELRKHFDSLYTTADGPGCAVCAPTGTAALNIGGETLHSLFQIKVIRGRPTASRMSFEEACLPASEASVWSKVAAQVKKQRFRQPDKFVNTKCFMIDEASMLTREQFLFVVLVLRRFRYKDAKKGDPLGGHSLALFLDPVQLGPQEDVPFSTLTSIVSTFAVFEMKENVRQRDDPDRSDCLFRNMFFGRMTADDINALEKRVKRYKPPVLAESLPTMVLALSNSEVASINATCMTQIQRNPRICNAMAVKVEDDNPVLQSQAVRDGFVDGRIEEIVQGSIVMCINNTTLTSVGGDSVFVPNGAVFAVLFVDVVAQRAFGRPIGLVDNTSFVRAVKTQTSIADIQSSDILITSVSIQRTYILGDVYVSTIPFVPSFAITCSKSQGGTFSSVCVIVPPRGLVGWASAAVTVAMSRVRSLKDLTITARVNSTTADPMSMKCLEFLQRLASKCSALV